MKARLASPIQYPIRDLSKRRFTATLAGLAMVILIAAMVRAPLSRAQSPEAMDTFASDCLTAKTIFVLGDTVCAEVTNALIADPAVGSGVQRRFEWVTPDGSLFQPIGPDITSATQNNSITIPLTGLLAQVGTWTVKSVDSSNNGHGVARFVVQDPDHPAVDLWCPIFAPSDVSAGSNVAFSVFVTNKGPNPAENVSLTVTVGTNSTFYSETQVTGPAFNCTNPSVGGTGSSTCTIAELPASATAQLIFVFQVDAGAQAGSAVTSTATVTSDTAELFDTDNTFTASATISPATCAVTCPSDITDVKDASQCGKVVQFTTPSGSGTGCGTVACSPASGSVFTIGTTHVVCAGASGASCAFSVTIQDSGTTIACPANKTQSEGSPGLGSAVVTYAAPTFPDACAVSSASCNPPSGSSFPVGTTAVNCQTTNSSNNPVSCSFTVTVTSQVCILNCSDDFVTTESSPGSGSATVSYSNPTSSGCPSVTITCNPPSGSSFSVGVTTVNCTAKDASQNTLASCSFRVTVSSTATCMINCPASISLAANSTCEGTPCAAVTYSLPTKSGNCSADPVVCTPPSGSSFGLGTTTVNCFAYDPAGNAGSCSFTVTVTGGTSCTITCPSNVSQPSDSGGCTAVVTYPDPTTAGSCGDPNTDPPNPHPWSCNPPSGSVFPVGTTTVTCATDVGASCSFTVTITGTDTVAPVITTCPTPTFALTDSTCQGPVPNVTSDVEATDNCTPTELLVITQSPAAGTLVGTGTTTITVTVRDASNNSSTCTTTFTLLEFTPPTALCKPYTAVLDGTGHASITAANVDNGSTDNCAIATRTVTPSTFTCANKGSNTVTLTVTDPSGNSSHCTTTVTVVDNTPPTITCPANVTKNNDLGLCSAIVSYPNATATDNCSGVGTPVCSPASGTTFPKGTTTVTCTVSDASGNPASCSFSVTVIDAQPPAISCPADITLEPTCPSGAIATYTAPVGTDNCPNATTARTAGPASGSVFPIGNTTVTYTVTDAVGLTASCSFTVKVKTAAATIQDMIARVNLLVNQGKLTGQQGQGLNSKLQAALDAVNNGQTNVACNKLNDFISQVTAYINNGTLTSADGQPLITSAAHVRNTLGCTSLGCS